MQATTGAYVPNRMKLTPNKETGRFTMEADYCRPNSINTSDHFQLIYEALEIAAHSDDRFKQAFRDMCDELLNLSKDWMD